MSRLKPLLLFLLMTVFAGMASAQGMGNPVRFKTSKKQIDENTFDVIFTASINKGWHVYGAGMSAGGPTSAKLIVDKIDGAKTVGKLKAVGKEHNEYDEMFGMKVRFYENNVTFIQRFKATGGKYHVSGRLEYGACNNEMCMPPTSVDFKHEGNAPKTDDKQATDKEQTEADAAETAGEQPVAPADSAMAATAPTSSTTITKEQISSSLWKPVIVELNALNGASDSTSSLWRIFLTGLLGGLIALLTPCVWPIIPMTVSFFLKRSKDNKRKAISDAVTYGLSIVIIYLTLGLTVTAIYGAQQLNDLATNAYVNVFFCLLLVVFALSFFGWFELTLPSSWSNKLDSKAGKTGGLLGIFLMAFTLSIVSFSCTGPIIGFLLVDFSTSGKILAPAIGMLGFAIALALPFTLFAMFPAWLKQAPKSGSWMNTIKVTLGFIELAFALKFFSVADLAYGWHLLDREVFISLWIIIFGMLGLYLCGILHFQSDMNGSEIKPKPVAAIMLGMISLAFTVYMLPGLWGAPCKAISAFAPPMNTQDFNLNNKEVKPKFLDYDEGMAAAAQTGKPVILDFTGFGCVNCRKMEAAVWTDPQVTDRLNNDYILISLYVDDKTPLKEPLEVTMPNKTKKVLRTVGDKWSYLEETKFGYLAQPFYVTVDADGKPLSGSFVYKEDVKGYMDFLDKGIEKMKK